MKWAARPAPFPVPDPSSLPPVEGIPPSLAAVLASRGLDGDRLDGFLDADVAGMAPWTGLSGAEEASSVIAGAVRDGLRILVHGDYDADGITAAALTCTALGRLGADAVFHVPDRFADGYGLGDSGVRACTEAGAGLLVTVDCGITAVDPIRALRESGIRTVVTDHHRPDRELPCADAIASPVLGDPGSPHADLSGAGTAWLVMQGVAERLGAAGLMEPLLQLAALGTVCDVVSLTGTNRRLVAAGLEAMRSSPLPGIEALASSASVAPADLTSRHLAFQLGPRINACGRVAHAAPAVRLLMAGDHGEAAGRVAEVERCDRLRRRLDGELRGESESMAGDLTDPRCIVLWKAGWPRGVIGISASRLAERYGVPVLLFSVEDGMAHGSARSVTGISIHDLLGRVQEETGMLDGFGGHPMAAGLRLKAGRLPELAAELERRLSDESVEPLLGPVLHVDGRLREEDLDLPTLRAIRRLEPFGRGNEEPVWLVRGAHPVSWTTVGRERNHLSCVLRVGSREVRAIGFGLAERRTLLDGRIDAAFTLGEDSWRGGGRVQLVLRDVRRTRNGDG